MKLGDKNWLPLIGAWIPILVFLFYCLVYLDRIGLSYDESVFVDAALGGITYDMVYKKFLDIPVLVMPYIGAIKPLIYYPVFKLFDVGIYSIRLPMIFLSALTLVIWYKNAKTFYRNPVLASAFLFIIATDPLFIIQSKLDFGPTVIQNFLLATSIYLFFRFLKNHSMLYLSFLYLALLTGVYNKANFIWFVSAFFLASAICFGGQIFQIYRNNQRVFLVTSGLFLLLLFIIIAYMIIPSALNFTIGNLLHVTPGEKIYYIYRLFTATLNGSVMFLYLFSDGVSAASLTNTIEWTTLGVWLVIMLLQKLRKHTPAEFNECNRYIGYFLLIFVLELTQIIMTPQGRLPAHLMVLWPLHHLIFIFILRAFYTLLPGAVFRNLLLLPPAALVMSQLYVNDIYLIQFKNPGAYKNPLWSPAVYSLSQYINQHLQQYDYVLSLDFGLNNQLFALAGSDAARGKFHDIWYFFDDDQDIKRARNFYYPMFNRSDKANWQWLYDTYFKDKTTLVIGFSDKEWIVGVTEKFYQFTVQYHLKVDLLPSIHDALNHNVYNLYAVSDQVTQSQSL